jgi:hypothetical protein
MYSPSPQAQEDHWTGPPRPRSIPPPLPPPVRPRTRGWEWWNWMEAEELSIFWFNRFWIRGLAAELWTIRNPRFLGKSYALFCNAWVLIWPVQRSRDSAGVFPHISWPRHCCKVTQKQNEERATPLEKQNYQQEKRRTSHCWTLPGQTLQ